MPIGSDPLQPMRNGDALYSEGKRWEDGNRTGITRQSGGVDFISSRKIRRGVFLEERGVMEENGFLGREQAN